MNYLIPDSTVANFRQSRAALVAVAVFLFQGVMAHAELRLTCGVYSSKKPTEMVKLYRPLLNTLETELSAQLGEPVEIDLQVVKTYDEGIKAIVAGTFDFTQIGPVSYVEAKDKSPGIEVLAIEGVKGQKQVNGVICVLSNSPVSTISDLRGKRFAFGDQSSTTGRYNAQLYLVEHGITSKDLAGCCNYLERHDRVGAAVAAGDYDAGALNERTFRKMVESGSPLRALAYFPIDGRPWVAKAGLQPKLKESLKKSLLKIKDKQVLSPIGEDGLTFLAGGDDDYASTRKAVRENNRFGP